jgi:hypothetical protein
MYKKMEKKIFFIIQIYQVEKKNNYKRLKNNYKKIKKVKLRRILKKKILYKYDIEKLIFKNNVNLL